MTRALAVALLATAIACSSAGAPPTPAVGLVPRTGRDVIEATRRADTATVTVRDHVEPVARGGGSEDGDYDVAFDFARDRARTRTQLPSGDGGPAIDVDARTVDGTTYVKDGSWLCPECGDDGGALPHDKWITVGAPAGDVAFALASNAFVGQLAWLRLVDEAIAPSSDGRLDDGTSVATYRTTVPVATANERIGAAAPRDEDVPHLQGETVVITFTADPRGRLRELVVEYRVEDRDRTLTATVRQLGVAVDIEVPPADEIYAGPDDTS